MKQLKNELYKASNVTFDPITCTAYSYGWWMFVRKVNGAVIFNEYRFSRTTQRHQFTIKNLMKQLGIDIDIVVSTQNSLNNPTWLKSSIIASTDRIHSLKMQLKKSSKPLNAPINFHRRIELELQYEMLDKLLELENTMNDPTPTKQPLTIPKEKQQQIEEFVEKVFELPVTEPKPEPHAPEPAQEPKTELMGQLLYIDSSKYTIGYKRTKLAQVVNLDTYREYRSEASNEHSKAVIKNLKNGNYRRW